MISRKVKAMTPYMVGFTLLLMVTSAWAGTFRDNFDHGKLGDFWQLHPWYGDQWSVENGELVCLNSTGRISTLFGGKGWWRDYEFQCAFKLEQTFPNNVNSSLVGIAVRNNRGDTGAALAVWSSGPDWNKIGCQRYVDGNNQFPNIEPFATQPGRWYILRIVVEHDSYQMFIDDRKICDFQSHLPKRGLVVVWARGCFVRFDNVVLTGPEIPDHNLAIEPKAKLTITWGRIKGF